MTVGRRQISSLAGLAGVDAAEREVARRWAQRLEWPMLLIALWIPVQWYLEEIQVLSFMESRIADVIVWSAFVFETVLLSSLVQYKKHYLLHNWMNLAIICAGVFIIWGYEPVLAFLRALRLILVIGILLRISRTLSHVLSQNNLGNTLAFALFVVVMSGIIMWRIDPAVHSAWEGIWWALVTVSTVGYGDVVPVSEGGRMFATFLIMLGIVTLAILTANISAYLIKFGNGERNDKLHEQLNEISARLEAIERQIKQIKAHQDDD